MNCWCIQAYCDILKRQYPGKRVHANVVYQQYIGDKEHLHMNATCWVTLTSFVNHLGRSGKCVIDETEKGWFVTWVEKDMEQMEYEKGWGTSYSRCSCWLRYDLIFLKFGSKILQNSYPAPNKSLDSQNLKTEQE